MRHSSALSHPKLVVEMNGQTAKHSRRVYIVQGISPEGRTLTINDSDINTLATALLERMYYCKVNGTFVAPPQVDKVHIFRTLREFRGKLLATFGGSPSRISPEEFSQMYTGRKRTIYEQAATDFTIYGVTRRDARSDAFVKCEKVNPTKAPRCIQPRRPVYNVAVGTYLKHIEHDLYRAIQRVFKSSTPVILKGMNANEIASTLATKWGEFDSPVAVGLDATKFDMHVSLAMLEWEHSIYTSLYPKDPELKKLLRWQRHNKGRGFCEDGTLRYSVEGRRFSGDMNTALGNCAIMCAMIYAYARERGVDIQLANNGDDCVVFMEAGELSKFSLGLDEWFISMGFRMTVEMPVYELEHVEFCQMHPINLGSRHVMCRNLSTAREKDSMCLFDISAPSAYSKWMGAVGECGLAIAGGVPIFQAMYAAYGRVGRCSKVTQSVQFQTGFYMLSRGMQAKWSPITEDARYSFYLAFGYTPDEQIAMEEYYQNLNLSDNTTTHCESLVEVYSSPL